MPTCRQTDDEPNALYVGLQSRLQSDVKENAKLHHISDKQMYIVMEYSTGSNKMTFAVVFGASSLSTAIPSLLIRGLNNNERMKS